MFCKNCGSSLSENGKYCKNCGTIIPISQILSSIKPPIKKGKKSRKKLFIILGILFLMAIFSFFVFYFIEKNKRHKQEIQNGIISSVVNIFCDNGGGGSGTIWLEEGNILTNNHVIAGSENCIVTIPEVETGAPAEIYNATPLIMAKLSDQYDIAALAINSVYIDSDGKSWGTFPKTFATFFDTGGCMNSSPKLGSKVIIYGYPVTSGGYNLTITDGIISSYADDGSILTSAKIDSGNSGGLAVDQEGCMIGIPSAVFTGDYQNLGSIIPANVISDFLNKIPSSE